MRILVVADIHNDVENVLRFLDKSAQLNYDVIVCPGDFTDIPPKGFTREEVGRVVIESLKSVGKPLVAVPGNWDIDIVKFFIEDNISAHDKGLVIADVGFYGFGGAETPFETAYEPSESDIESGIRRSYEKVKYAKFKILVTHKPPKNTKLDMIASGTHVGSAAVRKMIEEQQPRAAICAHIHEARGVDEIGSTKIINPGRFPEGYCGIIDVSDEGVEMKVISLI